jgi:four helix bundle protein
LPGQAIRHYVTAIKSVEEFEVWKASRAIVRAVYDLTRLEAFMRDFGLRDQIRRASISVMRNIAEGYESQTENVFIRHLGIAKGSCGEVRSQLYVALDQRYITGAESTMLAGRCCKNARQPSSLIRYLNRSS